MKKITIRGMSIVLSILMLISTFPLSVIFVTADDDTSVSTVDIKFNNDDAGTKAEAFASQTNFQPIARDEVSSMIPIGGYWKRPETLYESQLNKTAKKQKMHSLHYYLASNSQEDKYISLVKDLDWNDRKNEPEEIWITSDKVLDLNGHSITLRDDSNCRYVKQKGIIQDRTDVKWHNQVMFRIQNGATLTIIDSSQTAENKAGRGRIAITAKIIFPWNDSWIEHYTTRDLFWVDDGNLVIYGGNFQAGRKKSQVKSNFSSKKLKSFFGTALATGIGVANYATGINAAVAAKDDLVESFAKMGESASEDDGLDDVLSSTAKKAAGVKNEVKLQSPKDKNQSRDKTTGEKQNALDTDKSKEHENKSENGKNQPNKEESAKSDTKDDTKDSKKEEKGKNSQIADANKKIVDAALDKQGLTDIFNNVWSMGEQIEGMIGTDESTRLTETIFGTVVHVGNGGTFVSYGGTFAGHGSTPNVRDAVVEIVRGDKATSGGQEGEAAVTRYPGGKAYIYGGSFAAYSGANVFNFVQSAQTKHSRYHIPT